jgi:hypothetical protein
MNGVLLIIVSLVSWRITHLLAKEDGPFDIIFWLRKKAGSSFWGSLLDCFYCVSIWVSLPLAIWTGQTIKEIFFLWFAYSGAACLLEKITDRRNTTENDESIYSKK